ncbi:ABC-F family ATP-binding cassette domain-containing protein [Melioribacteraceae bacterium 4301-Me]|uniref:ABC-F family ATP-binding cassette domain-containing protein n=1 Tax=Pyranulibacter aquaticus TaxID=3163344 RepID=UPI0035982196
MIDITNLSMQFLGKSLFEHVNLHIDKNDKIALVGSNGSGKSTFLKILAGQLQPETGEIKKQNRISIGYLPQELTEIKGKRLFNEVKSSIKDAIEIIDTEKFLLNELNKKNISPEKKEKLLDELGALNHTKEKIDFYSIDSKIEKTLIGLGFNEDDFFKITDEFSGGWQMRIQLAKILLGENDLILLDEPTNYLDIDSLQWLINFLKNIKSALIVVSHDRHFINEVTNKTLEIYNNSITFFNKPYNDFLVFKSERENSLKKLIKEQSKKIKQTQRFIERFRYKATKAKQVQTRIKQLEKINEIELTEPEEEINIKFPEPTRSGAVAVEFRNVSKAFNENYVLKDLSFTIERGDKIAIVGPNGAGKTTLSKLIAGKLTHDFGEIIFGHNVHTSFYSQEIADELSSDKDILDTLSELNEELTIWQLRAILGAFLFKDDDVFKKINILSGGEKSRVALIKLLLTPANLIVMDEPTNHLDYSSKSVLQKALIEYNGILVIVTHDIDFVNPIVNKVFELRNAGVKIYNGNIDYYLSKRENFSEKESNQDKYEVKNLTKKDLRRKEAEIRQQKYEASKEIKASIQAIEQKIEGLEKQKKELENQLSDYNVFSNPLLSKEKNIEYFRIKNELEKLFEEWANLNNKLELIETSFSSLQNN